MTISKNQTMTVDKLHCLRPHCLYVWYPKPGRGRPGVCPRCKSYIWDQPVLKKTKKA